MENLDVLDWQQDDEVDEDDDDDDDDAKEEPEKLLDCEYFDLYFWPVSFLRYITIFKLSGTFKKWALYIRL